MEASNAKRHLHTNESEAKKKAELAQIAVQQARSDAEHKDNLKRLELNKIASELAAKLKSEEKQENALEAAYNAYMKQYEGELAAAVEESQKHKKITITNR